MTDPFDRSFRDRTLAGEVLYRPVPRPRLAGIGRALRRGRLRLALIDLEHGASTEATCWASSTRWRPAGRSRSSGRSRASGIRIGRALDIGARGIMVPRLESAGQAGEAVSFLRYPPDGIRGVATRVRGAGLGAVPHADVRRLNERVVGIIQIESAGGLRDADAIAAIDGVDVLFVGPGRPVALARDRRASSSIPTTSTRSTASSPPAGPTARRPDPRLRHRASSRATSSSGSRSSGSARTRRSSRPAPPRSSARVRA